MAGDSIGQQPIGEEIIRIKNNMGTTNSQRHTENGKTMTELQVMTYDHKAWHN